MNGWLGTGSEQDIINIKNNLAGTGGAYSNLMTALTDFQTKFINQLADKWACVDAVNFSNIFAETVDRLVQDVNNMFINFFGVIDQAGNAWATSLQTTYAPINFSPSYFKIDVSMIRENINGVRGIDKDQAMTVINNLSTIQYSVSDSLGQARNVIASNPNFFGQSTAYLIQSMTNIESVINNAVSEIILATQNAVKATIEHYENTAGKIAQAFANQI